MTLDWVKPRQLARWIPLWAAVLLVGLVVARPSPASPLEIGASLWPPYFDPKLPDGGLAASIVVAAFRRAGYEPAVTIGPWQSVLETARSGSPSVIAAAWWTPQREQDLLFSQPYLTNEIKFVKRRGDAVLFDSPRDLAGLRIGVVFGYAYDESFDRATDFIRVPESHVIPNLLQLLARNIDLTLGDERTLRYEISRHLDRHNGELQLLSNPLRTRELHVAVSRSHPHAEKLVGDFNRAFEEMQEDGSYRALLRQANEEIWKQSYLPE